MGINDLLKIYSPLIQNIHLSSLRGKSVAIDMMVWLYRGVYASLNNESSTSKSDLYLNFPLKMLSLLKSYNINCIAVFDGKNPPAKYMEIESRKNYKEQSLELAKSLSLEGREEESKKVYKRTLKIKSRMINSLIDILKKMNIEIIVAPYEADSQISYLYKTHQIDFAISEDSDLIPYGIKKIAFKLDSIGNLNFLDLTKQIPHKNIKDGNSAICEFLQSLPHYKLVQFCVMLGCDYLSSPKGLGVKSCYKLFSTYNDIETIISMMKLSGNFRFEKDDDKAYLVKFKKAVSVFYMQTVYDNIRNKLRPINDLNYNEGEDSINDLEEKVFISKIYDKVEDKDYYYGEWFENYENYCNGNIDVKTLSYEKKRESIDVLMKYYNKYAKYLTDRNCIVKKFIGKEKYITLRENKESFDIENELNFLQRKIGIADKQFIQKKRGKEDNKENNNSNNEEVDEEMNELFERMIKEENDKRIHSSNSNNKNNNSNLPEWRKVSNDKKEDNCRASNDIKIE